MTLARRYEWSGTPFKARAEPCRGAFCWASLLPPRLVGMAGDAGNRLETTHQDTAFYIKTLVLPRWLTLSFCPENIKKTDLETSENHEKTILGASGTPRGGCLGATWAPRTKKHQKKTKKGAPWKPPLGSIGAQFFIILAENLIFWVFFSRRFSELVFLWFWKAWGRHFSWFLAWFSIFFEVFLHILRIVKTVQTAVTSFQNGVRHF